MFCLVAPLELADTAVKVGLGAAISGLPAFWLGERNNKHANERAGLEERAAIERARLDRRDRMLEATAEEVEVLMNAWLSFWSLAADTAQARDAGAELHPDQLAAGPEIERTLDAGYRSLNAAEWKLLFLGEKEVQQRLRALTTATTAFNRAVRAGGVPHSRVVDARNEVDQLRSAFFDVLSTRARALPPDSIAGSWHVGSRSG